MHSSRPGKEGDANSMLFPFVSEGKEGVKETILPGVPQIIRTANRFRGTVSAVWGTDKTSDG